MNKKDRSNDDAIADLAHEVNEEMEQINKSKPGFNFWSGRRVLR